MSIDIMKKYEGLRFSYADMEREIKSMRLLSKKFVTAETYERVIPSLLASLVGLKTVPAGSHLDWEIKEEDPITTKPSSKYEVSGRKCSHNIVARISGKWEIMSDNLQPGNHAKYFLLKDGAQASLKVTLVDEAPKTGPIELARWSMDVGDKQSPGCHFHTQVNLGQQCHFFPKSLPVPRFPCLLFTPMDTLEFVLAELFQSDWRFRVSDGSDVLHQWSSCQRKRLINLLDWQRTVIYEAAGSPWTTLKHTKPGINALDNPKS